MKKAVLSSAVLSSSFFLLFNLSQAQVGLEVDMGYRIEDLKRIIDFFNLHNEDFGATLSDLKPRFNAHFGGLGPVDKIKSAGMTPVANLHGLSGRSAAKNLVNANKAKVRHWQLWSEPNRTWGPRINEQDNWLRTATWQSFVDRAAELARGAREADPQAILCGPVLTGDNKNDLLWNRHLVEFLAHFGEKNVPLNYVTFNPPWDPGQVQIVSALAKSFAATYPNMGLKGISIGEYPFFKDASSLHVRFFIAFEESWNMLYAAKSHFRKDQFNSGLLDGSTKLPAYWVFYHYARMQGKRLQATTGSGGLVAVLASYDEKTKKLQMLVGNDQTTVAPVNIRLKSVSGQAAFTISQITKSGLLQVKKETLTANAEHRMELSLGTVPAQEAYFITADFVSEQKIVGTPVLIHGTAPRSGLAGHAGGAARLFHFPGLTPVLVGDQYGEGRAFDLSGKRMLHPLLP